MIAEKPLWEYVPCFRGQNGEIVTQFAMKEVEKAGLVKFDFLGLKTLTVIQTAVRLINQQRAAPATPFDIDAHPQGRRRRLQDDLGGRHHRRVPARIERASARS